MILPLTARQLLAMSRGRRDAEWDRVAWLAAHLLNAQGAKIRNFRKLLPFETDEAQQPEATGTIEDLNRVMGLA